ncbi:flagellar basal body P-ring formation chaperone FlgA [bacterium]|nr:flagellar basal body P-ring formation chaperone FlgA [bacterium]
MKANGGLIRLRTEREILEGFRPRAVRPYARLAFAAVIAAAMLLAIVSHASGDPIGVHDEIVVNADVVRLGDVADGLPRDIADTFLCKAPSLGVKGRLSGSFVAARIRQAGAGDAAVAAPASIRVTRASRTIAPETIADLVLAHVRERKAGEGEASVAGRVRSLLAPAGDVELFVVDDAERYAPGYHTVAVTARAEGFEKTTRVRVLVDAPATILVARHTIARGDSISRDDLETRMVPARRVRGSEIRDLSHAVGRVADRAIASGEVLARGAITPAPIVKKGDLVTLVADIGAVRVSAIAVVMEQGGAGETTEVRNLDSGAVLKARIVDAHTAQVEL